MKLSELKVALTQSKELDIFLPNGMPVPAHFHITEVGHIEKNFIDCGGTIRKESRIGLQLWINHADKDHRLTPERLLQIIELSENALHIPNDDIEVEYQADTISKYGLSFDGMHFHLVSTQTACLAEDQCVTPKRKVALADLPLTSTNCNGASGCC